jgi:hypothetical protein
MNAQGWNIRDVYRNTSRDEMPQDETLTGFENTLIEAARLAIERHGDDFTATNGERIYRIRTELPANVEPLSSPKDQIARLRQKYLQSLEGDLADSGTDRGRAAYLAICLGETTNFKRDQSTDWEAAVTELKKHPAVVKNLFAAPAPTGEYLRQQGEQAGLGRSPGDDG